MPRKPKAITAKPKVVTDATKAQLPRPRTRRTPPPPLATPSPIADQPMPNGIGAYPLDGSVTIERCERCQKLIRLDRMDPTSGIHSCYDAAALTATPCHDPEPGPTTPDVSPLTRAVDRIEDWTRLTASNAAMRLSRWLERVAFDLRRWAITVLPVIALAIGACSDSPTAPRQTPPKAQPEAIPDCYDVALHRYVQCP